MKVEKKSYEQHPEGWFLFLLGEPEATEATWDGVTKPRLKWPCTSMSVKTEEGGEFIVNLFTGVTMSDDPRDLHLQLVEDGFGIDRKEYEDTDEITGKMFAGKVEHKKTTGKANIVKFDTQDRIKPSGKSGLPKSKKADAVANTEFNDPFAEE